MPRLGPNPAGRPLAADTPRAVRTSARSVSTGRASRWARSGLAKVLTRPAIWIKATRRRGRPARRHASSRRDDRGRDGGPGVALQTGPGCDAARSRGPISTSRHLIHSPPRPRIREDRRRYGERATIPSASCQATRRVGAATGWDRAGQARGQGDVGRVTHDDVRGATERIAGSGHRIRGCGPTGPRQAPAIRRTRVVVFRFREVSERRGSWRH
jgi:hypothetical protein